MKHALFFIAALALTACATTPTDTKTSNAPQEEKHYRVGSRIPVKDTVGASPTATMDSSSLSNLPTRPAN